MRIIAALVALAILPTSQPFAQQPEARAQFVYVLQLEPRFQEEAAWTDTENAAAARHFEYLANAAKSGQLIIAGRTLESLDKTFGLVIFEAESETAAREFMQSDPAVTSGLMVATLHPYTVALQRQ